MEDNMIDTLPFLQDVSIQDINLAGSERKQTPKPEILSICLLTSTGTAKLDKTGTIVQTYTCDDSLKL